MQSSNSVYVAQPSQRDQNSDNDAICGVAISAIAQCGVMLELVPTSPPCTDFLKRSLSVYSGPEGMFASISQTLPSRDALLQDAPFSSGEFDKAWKKLCVFEVERQARLPTASVLINLWKSLVSAATVRNVNLRAIFSMNAIEGVIEEDGYPNALFRAVIDRLASANEDLMDGCK